jgi:hypothetical protein
MKYTTKKIEIRKELKIRVREWLIDSGVKFIEDKKPIALGSSPVDFLIIEPFLMVIEVKWFSQFLWQFKEKDILAQRINLASQYGRYMPVIAVTSREGENTEEIPQLDIGHNFLFFDHVIDGENLPNFQQFRESIKLNALVQDILKRGEPIDFHITDSQEVETMWGDSLNLSSFLQDETFSNEGIAKQLRKLSQDCLSIDRERKLGNNLDIKSNNAQTLRLLPKFKQGFKEVIKNEIMKFGGELEEYKVSEHWSRYKLPLPKPIIWRSPYGRVVAVQVLFAFNFQYKNNRARQLIADAWMIRALLENKVDDLVMLLEKSEDNKSATYFINVLESAGWTVLPWDFAKKRPLFMEFILEEREVFYERIAKAYA